MAWLLSLALVVLAVGLLAWAGLRLYRAVRSLLRRLSESGEAVSRAGSGLDDAQMSPAGHPRRVP